MNKCCCGNDARFVSNGMNANLNYWYCDECKDVATLQSEEIKLCDSLVPPDPEPSPEKWVDPSGAVPSPSATNSGRFPSNRPNVSKVPSKLSALDSAIELAKKLNRRMVVCNSDFSDPHVPEQSIKFMPQYLDSQHPFWRRQPTSRTIGRSSEIYCWKGDKIFFSDDPSKIPVVILKTGVYCANATEMTVEWKCPLAKFEDRADEW